MKLKFEPYKHFCYYDGYDFEFHPTWIGERLLYLTRWPRYLMSCAEYLRRQLVCHFFDHRIEVDGYAGPESAEETIYCDRCGAQLSHTIYY